MILPLGVLTIGVGGMWLARVIASSRPAPVASGGSPSGGTSVPFSLARPQNIVRPAVAFDTSRIGDPLASKTEWFPLKNGGAGSFRIHKLVETDLDRLEYRATTRRCLFSLAFFLPGVLVSYLRSGSSSLAFPWGG